MDKSRQITFRLTDEQFEHVTARSIRERRKVGQIIRILIDRDRRTEK